MANFIWGDGGAQMTPEAIAAQRKVAQAMMQRGSDYSPIQSAWQGAARLSEGLMGGLDARMADVAERKNAAAERELLASLISGQAAPTATASPVAAPVAAPVAPPGTDQAVYPPPAAPGPAPTTFRPGIAAPTGDAASAIAAIESGGAYDKLGPVTRTGDRAYGKYQVMGANVPQWTRTHLGQEMTPEQFLASPEAQDAVFKGQFGQYAGKYGPEGAAKAWFAGERGMNNPNAKDQLGTSVQAYADKFSRGYQGAPAAVDPAAIPPTAQPAQGFAVPGQPAPAVSQVAQAMSGVNPKILAGLTSPYTSEGTKKILGIMLQSQMGEKVSYQTTPDGDILALDPHGRAAPKVVYQATPKPIAVPENSQLWDPRTKSFIGGGPSAIPASVPGPGGTPVPVPQNLSPRDAREFTKKITESAAASALPPDYKEVQKMREDFVQLPAYKNLAQAAPIYNSMREAAGRDTKAADLNMVYGLGKIFDPTSVVREGELQMANAAQGVQERLNGIIAQIQSKGGLTPAGREALMAEAHGRVTSYKGEFDRDASRFKGIAERSRINPADILPEFGTFEPWTAPKATSAPIEIDGYKIKAK